MYSLYGRSGRQMKLLEQTTYSKALSPEPRVTIQLSEAGHLNLVLRFPPPPIVVARIERVILLRYQVSMS